MKMKILLILGTLLLTSLLSLAPPLAAQDEGGTMTFAIDDFSTLDIHLGEGSSMAVSWLLGATLVSRDTEAQYHPWLAESWEISEDGLHYTFHLRDDVRFHDGKPLTAADFVWTISRLIDPETGARQAGRMVAVDRVEAPDDTTLEIHLKNPYPLLLEQLSNTGVVQPYHPEYFAEAGDQFGQGFIGVGPYQLEEFRPGDRIVLARNPDFNWGPPFVENQGPYHIERMEFVVITEPSTIVAGLETGELDYAAVQASDVAYLRGLDHLTILERPDQGMFPALHLNLSQPPFDDIRVRRAFNHAVDRDLLVEVVLEGLGAAQYGPLSSTLIGYWEGVEEIGYRYDPEAARALLAEAGYEDGLALELKCLAVVFNRLCEVLQQMYAEVGVELEITLLEIGPLWSDAVLEPNYTIMTMGYLASEFDILYRWFHSSRENALNPSRSTDLELDRLLDNTRNDVANYEMWVDEVQRYIVEQAMVVPLYAPLSFVAINNRVQGYLENPANLVTWAAFFNDASLSGE